MGKSANEYPDIQAILRGFSRSYTHAFFSMMKFSDSPADNREFLGSLGEALAVCEVPTSIRALNTKPSSGVTVGLSAQGLRRLGVAPSVLRTFPDDFREGMAARAAINGDIEASAPDRWDDCWGEGVDLLLGVFARSAEVAEEVRQRLVAHIDANGAIREVGVEHAHRLLRQGASDPTDDRAVIEHFGFDDGISMTPVEGLVRNEPQRIRGAGKITGDGNWETIAAGEFLYGYTDEIGEVPPSPTPRTIGRNGTYLVYRKLSQDVGAFHDYTHRAASHYPGLTGDDIAEKMVGRRRTGEPLVGEPAQGNDFAYTSDPNGRQCPLGSHVRRTNPRDSLGFQSLLVDRHRILRRGITYGSPMSPAEDAATADRGLLFLACNISIERQFEFVQREWVNFGNDFNQGGARDPLIGSQVAGSGTDEFMFSMSEQQPLVICRDVPQFVTTRGGEYFFVPGLHAFQMLVDDAFNA